MEWHAMSPSAPVPKSHQPRHLNGAYAGWYGRAGAGPSHNSQSSQDGVKYSSSGRSSACGQIGRLVHSWISRTVPMAPASTHSRIWRVPSSACPWLPICVATLYFLAAWTSCRTSQTVRASGFWMRVCLPSFIAIMPATVCV